MRASSSPTCPTPKTATAGTDRQRLEQHASPRRRSIARRARTGALSDSSQVIISGTAAGFASCARARSIATASRLPPPIEPHVPVGAHHHLGARRARRVAADRGERHEHAGLAGRSQRERPRPARAHQACTTACCELSEDWCIGAASGPRSGGTRPGNPRSRRRACRRRPGRAPARPPRTPPRAWPGEARSTLVPAGPKAAAAWRSASRTENASISGGSPTALEP